MGVLTASMPGDTTGHRVLEDPGGAALSLRPPVARRACRLWLSRLSARGVLRERCLLSRNSLSPGAGRRSRRGGWIGRRLTPGGRGTRRRGLRVSCRGSLSGRCVRASASRAEWGPHDVGRVGQRAAGRRLRCRCRCRWLSRLSRRRRGLPRHPTLRPSRAPSGLGGGGAGGAGVRRVRGPSGSGGSGETRVVGGLGDVDEVVVGGILSGVAQHVLQGAQQRQPEGVGREAALSPEST